MIKIFSVAILMVGLVGVSINALKYSICGKYEGDVAGLARRLSLGVLNEKFKIYLYQWRKNPDTY